MQQFGLNLFFGLAVAATIFVVFVSIVLVLRKGIEIRLDYVRRRLYDYYSSLLAEILLTELPQLPAGAKTSAIFKHHESQVVHIKDKMKWMTTRTRNYHLDAIRQVLSDFSKDLTGETSEKIVYYVYSFNLLDDLLKQMNSRRWWIRAQAIRTVGLLKAKRVITPLTAALEDSHPDVRMQAMISLLTIVGVPALSTIFRISRRFSQWNSIELSVIVMGYRENAAPYLVEALYSPDQSIVLFSIAMLAEIGFVDAVEPLLKLLDYYPSSSVQAASAEALGRLSDERAIPSLINACTSSNLQVRMNAEEALGRLQSVKGIPSLKDRLVAGSIEEKLTAARALRLLGPDGIDALESFRDSSTPVILALINEVMEDPSSGI
ncbi:MAG: HEAT repeat domain-containing protein [bacterium]